ncbi:MAG: porphobilinogen synthase, partial [Pseudomonadota bacterium]
MSVDGAAALVTPKEPTDTTRLVDELTGNTRLRRMRRTPWLRDMVVEARLTVADLILPIFIIEGEDRDEPIEAMPGVMRHTVDRAVEIARKAAELGIPVIAPFPN